MIPAQVVKELRENARWAALGAAVLSGLLAWLLYTDRARGMTLVGDTFTVFTMVAFGAAGAVLGMAITLPDLRRGHWGFAAHRPAARWKLFAAKYVAGALLYVVATTIALLIATACAASPRYVQAPFDIRFLVPSLFYQLQGLMWLATGMLIAVRPARWIGSRMFPAVFTLAAAALPQAVAIYFYEGALITLAATAVLLIAAGAYFCHNGQYSRQPLWTRVLATLTVFAGAAGLLTVVFNVAKSSIDTFFETPGTYNSRQYSFGTDGRVYRTVIKGNRPTTYDHTGRAMAKDELRNVHVVSAARPSPDDRPPLILVPIYSTPWAFANLPRGIRTLYTSFLRGSTYLEIIGIDTSDAKWSLVKTRRTLEVHDRLGDYVGSLSAAGDFGPAPQSFPEWVTPSFAGGRRGTVTLVGPTRAYVLAYSDRQIREAYHADTDGPIQGLAFVDLRGFEDVLAPGDLPSPYESIDGQLRQAAVVVATPGKLRVIWPDGRPPTSVAIDTGDWTTQYQMAVLPDGIAVLMQRHGSRIEAAEVITVRNGVETRDTAPPLYGPGGPPGPADGWRVSWTENVIAAVVPAAMWPVVKWMEEDDLTHRGFWITAFSASALAGLLTFGIARRDGLARGAAAAWTAAAVLIGLHVPLTLLCLRNRPTLVPCPACGRWRSVERDACEHCGAAWPLPGDAATSVFEPDGRKEGRAA